ncbi:MAG TPA: hypothetical protein VG603_02350 [Chitinophagales bacterium]|nr:hypothetical protein [Chitinophagales bacterium]
MLTDEQIAASLIGDITAKLKKANGQIKPADWGPNYVVATNIAAEISVHCKSGVFPESLMKAKAPNETAQELQYRKDIYEAITVPYWQRALSVVNRIWAEQNYSIQWNNEDYRQYLSVEYPLYGSIISWFKTVFTPYKINDPNAVLVIDTGELPMKENGDGELIPDQAEELEPSCVIYASNKVLYFDMNEYCLLLTDEKRPVNFGGKMQLQGLVFYLYTTTSKITIVQVGQKSDYNFVVESVYLHELGYLPAQRLGGIQIPECQEDDIVYKSFFSAAIPYLNKALKLDSTLDVSINKHAYPIRAYYKNKCSNPLCDKGRIPVYDPMNTDAMNDTSFVAANAYKTCPDCGGTGELIGFSPMRDYIHAPQGNPNIESPIPFPGFAYISPDSGILEFVGNKTTADIEKAFMFMNIDVSLKGANNGVGSIDKSTATKAKIDREELFAFLLNISEQVFSSLQFAIDTLVKIRYPNAKEKVSINFPMNFDIRDLDELTEEISKAQQSNLPDMVQRELSKEYMQMRFPAQKNMERIADIIFYCDPLATRSVMDITALKSQFLISDIDAVLHVHIYYFIEQKMSENPDYLLTDLQTIKSDMQAMAKDKLTELNAGKPASSAAGILSGLDNFGG